MGGVSPPRPLSPDHRTTGFDCGADSLNDWLSRQALKNERRGASRTYVVCDNHQVIGYYTIAAGSITRAEAPGAIKRNMPDPIPAVILGRLAVDRRRQGRRIGSGLLKDAILRSLNVASQVGARVLVVHVLDEAATAFYRRHGFVESLLAPSTMMLPLT